jgi:hypothetical protein
LEKPIVLKSLSKVSVITAIVVVTACSTKSTGVLPLGPDTFSVLVYTSRGTGSVPAARVQAIDEAEKYCASLSKKMLVKQAQDGPGHRSELIFQCLNENDPEYKRPDYEKSTGSFDKSGFQLKSKSE